MNGKKLSIVILNAPNVQNGVRLVTVQMELSILGYGMHCYEGLVFEITFITTAMVSIVA